MADRQCCVLIGPSGQCLVDEQMTWHRPDGIEDALVADAAPRMRTVTQALDQAVTHAL